MKSGKRPHRPRRVDPKQLSIENWLEVCLDKAGKKYKLSREELLKQLERENGTPT